MPKYDEVKDSGKRQEFQTGSQRDTQEGKGRYDLLPTRALKRLAKYFENGARKYNPNNWKLGQPLSRYMDSALRHTFKYLEGHIDEDHITAAVWNLMCLIETQELIEEKQLPEELNDIPYTMDRVRTEAKKLKK